MITPEAAERIAKKYGGTMLPPDHPIYSQGVSIRFINHTRKDAPITPEHSKKEKVAKGKTQEEQPETNEGDML